MMRQEQMMGGLISSIDVNCRICSCEFFFMVFKLKKEKNNSYKFIPLEGTKISTVLLFLLQMSTQEKILLVLILVSEWTVAGK